MRSPQSLRSAFLLILALISGCVLVLSPSQAEFRAVPSVTIEVKSNAFARLIMLREKLKQELDKLNEEQLKRIADFIAFIEFQSKQVELSSPFWQRTTPVERAKEFREWVSQLPKTDTSLPDEAFSRESIYEE